MCGCSCALDPKRTFGSDLSLVHTGINILCNEAAVRLLTGLVTGCKLHRGFKKYAPRSRDHASIGYVRDRWH